MAKLNNFETVSFRKANVSAYSDGQPTGTYASDCQSCLLSATIDPSSGMTSV